MTPSNPFADVDFDTFRCPETDAIQLDDVWRSEGGPPTATGCLYLQSLMEIHPVKSRQVAALALMNALFFEAMEDSV